MHKSLYKAMDPGPKSFALLRLGAPQLDDMRRFLLGSETNTEWASCAAQIVSATRTAPSQEQRQWDAATAVYWSNWIEQSSLDSIQETHQLLFGDEKGDWRGDDTRNLYTLFQKQVDTLSADAMHEWNATVLGKSSSAFRERGAYALGTKHIYPHHEVIEMGIGMLCEVFGKIQAHLAALRNEKHGDPVDVLLQHFAAAAWVQFHFVDLHPYADGNGRMCRLLSKWTLDPVLCRPVPMFRDRNLYFEALEQGQKAGAMDAHHALLGLLLDEAEHAFSL